MKKTAFMFVCAVALSMTLVSCHDKANDAQKPDDTLQTDTIDSLKDTISSTLAADSSKLNAEAEEAGSEADASADTGDVAEPPAADPDED